MMNLDTTHHPEPCPEAVGMMAALLCGARPPQPFCRVKDVTRSTWGTDPRGDGVMPLDLIPDELTPQEAGWALGVTSVRIVKGLADMGAKPVRRLNAHTALYTKADCIEAWRITAPTKT